MDINLVSFKTGSFERWQSKKKSQPGCYETETKNVGDFLF